MTMRNKLWWADIMLKAIVGSGTWWVMSSYTNPLWLVILVTLMAVASTSIKYEVTG